MSMTEVLKDDDTSEAVGAFSAPDSFDHNKFFNLVGLKNSSKDIISKLFQVLDKDERGFLEEEDLSLMMKAFDPKGRTLSAKETKDLLNAGDKKGDGKLSMDVLIQLQKKILELKKDHKAKVKTLKELQLRKLRELKLQFSREVQELELSHEKHVEDLLNLHGQLKVLH